MPRARALFVLTLLALAACKNGERDKSCDLDDAPDGDHDLHFNPAWVTDWHEDCDPIPDVLAAYADDCDDANPDRFPGNPEVCDGIDNDCDDSTTEDDAVDMGTWYADDDGDGLGNPNVWVTACDVPDGHVANSDDLDDTVKDVADTGDTDTDTDTDTDGDGYSAADGDCDDSNSSIYPGAEDVPYNTIDEDCSGADMTDVDGDGYDAEIAGGDDTDDTDPDEVPTNDDDGDGYSPLEGDCDDVDSMVYPGAWEQCDGIDNNCDGYVDNDVVYTTVYPDVDLDGYGAASGGMVACVLPDGDTLDGSDCEDHDGSIHPDADEICNSVDDDCDDLTDDEDTDLVGGLIWYAPDADSDGYATSDDRDFTYLFACEAPAGYAASTDDCDDTNPLTYPGAAEVCDGERNDCDVSEADWDSSAEYGLVTFLTDDGTWTDLVGVLSTTAGTVTDYTISEDGALNFCADPTAPETWYVSITIDPRLSATITGIHGSASVILSGDTTDRVIYASYDTLAVEGLTIVDGYASVGAGIYATGTTLGLSDLVLTDNLTESGTYSASVVLEATSATFAGVQVSGNDTGYGLICEDSDLSASNLSISNNSTGGLYLNLSAAKITDSSLSDNDNAGLTLSNAEKIVLLDGVNITKNGFGIYANYAGTLELKNTDIFLNSPGYGTSGAGIYVAYSGAVSMVGSQIYNNTANYSGGGVFFGSYGGGTTTLSIDATSAIYGNIATYGGGLYLLNSSYISCAGGEISGNTASYGDGAYLGGGSITSTGCDWSDNSIYVEPMDTTYAPADLPDPFTCTTAGCY